jgi:hypothetical protein
VSDDAREHEGAGIDLARPSDAEAIERHVKRGTPREVAETAIALARNATPPDRIKLPARDGPQSFAVTGRISGRPTTIVWEDGQILADAEARFAVERLIELGEYVHATPTSAARRCALEPADIALLTIAAVFDEGAPLEITGDRPAPASNVPDGAIP